MGINSKYEVFLASAELGSISKAADLLGYSQSGASRLISSLEDELGVPLLVRNRTGLELTPCGVELLECARELNRLDRRVQEIVSGFKGLRSGRVRIGTFSILGTFWIPQMVKSFQKEHPNISFEIYNEHCDVLTDFLLSGRIDLAFMSLPVKEKMECIPLRDERMVAVLPAGHPKGKAACFPVSEFAWEDYILTYRGAAMSVFQKAGVRPHIKYVIADASTAISMVENGFGVTLLPEMVLNGHSREALCVKELDRPYFRSFGIVLPGVEKASPAVRSFIAHAKKWVDGQEIPDSDGMRTGISR